MTAPDINIPDEALEKATMAIYAILEGPIADQDYGRQVRQWELAQSLSRAACLAMLKAWPGGETVYGEAGILQPVIYLPIPMESANGEG